MTLSPVTHFSPAHSISASIEINQVLDDNMEIRIC